MTTYSGPNANFQSEGVWQNLTCDGPIKAVPVECDFGVSETFEFDLLYAQQQSYLPGLGTIWVDNAKRPSGGATPNNVTITFGSTNQFIFIEPDTQGYYPVIAPEVPRFTVRGQAGAAPAQIIMLSALLPGFRYSVTP